MSDTSSPSYKTISFGGLGDSFIVWLKLHQIFSGDEFESNHHLFVESNPVTCELIKEYAEMHYKFDCEVICDKNYQESFHSGKWPDRRIINTTWHGDYPFPGPDGIRLMDDFAKHFAIFGGITRTHDVCIQVAAGANSSRHWKFDPRKLRDLLESKGHRVALVGTAEEYKEDDEPSNYVCKTNLRDSTHIVNFSKVYCGLSGFHTYNSLSKGHRNIHLEESPEHNAHYIHPSWEEYRYGIKYGSLSEVIAGLRHWGIEV